MRPPWPASNATQLDLRSGEPAPPIAEPRQAKPKGATATTGGPCFVPIAQIDEDPAHPRVEFSDTELDQLTADIRVRGILVPLVIHPADANDRYGLHFGAMRLRAAVLAGLHEVPVVVRDASADRYAQVAENQKRHNLSSLDLSRFIRDQLDAGDSQTTIARQLGMNLTTVAHHLSLLGLPPELDDALKVDRCTSPRTLHELSKLHDRQPEEVRELLDGTAAITREAVVTLRARVNSASASRSARLIAQAIAACDRLTGLLARIPLPSAESDRDDLAALHAKLSALSGWSASGSDRQTP